MQISPREREDSTGFAGGIYTDCRNSTAQTGLKGVWMPSVTYVSSDGIFRKVDVPPGMSVMQAALNHKVAGILGECGGNCMCATCHVYVDASFLNRIPPLSDNEKFMLSIAAEGPETSSRLSCQIKMTEELDGIIVRLPSKQK
jgi:2Fe-2S ferredoxin